MFKTICLQTSRLWGFHQIKPPLSPTILTKGAQGINLLKKWPEYILLWWEHQFFRYRCKCAYLITFQTGLLHWSRSRPGAMNCHTASLGPGGAHVKRVVEMQHLKSSYFYCINVCPGCIGKHSEKKYGIIWEFFPNGGPTRPLLGTPRPKKYFMVYFAF